MATLCSSSSGAGVRIAVVIKRGREDYLTLLPPMDPHSIEIITTGSTIEELGDKLKEANVLLTLRGNSLGLGDILPHAPQVRWIQSISAGVERIITTEVIDRRIILTNAKGVMSSALAEYVMAAIGFFAKDFRRLLQLQKDHIWGKNFTVKEIRGSTMGIVGYGDIGRACAQLAKASGMKVIGLRRNPPFFSSNSHSSREDEFVDSVVGPESLLDLCRESDYLVVAVALTPATQRMLNKNHFAAAKPGQVIINVARGGVIAEDDLVDALRNGEISGAALDVFAVEPLPAESPLWDLENVLISPHNVVTDSRRRVMEVFAENCRRFAAEEDLLNVVNTFEGY